MDEKRVRKTTGALLAAYQELVGCAHNPTIQEFLLLRDQAIKEAGFARTSPVTDGFGYQNKEEQTRKNKPDPADGRESVHLSFPHPAPSEEKEETLFSYSFQRAGGSCVKLRSLRRIQDPWND